MNIIDKTLIDLQIKLQFVMKIELSWAVNKTNINTLM